MTGHQPITIASVYLPPKTLVSGELKKLLNLGVAVITVGDLNSKQSRVRNPNGRILESLTNTLSFEIITLLRPTHYPKNRNCRPDLLDIVLLKNVSLSVHTTHVVYIPSVHDDQVNSNHCPVVPQLDTPLSITDVQNDYGSEGNDREDLRVVYRFT
ncbi:hypothetical protein EVAR_18178_1 [Eumeta japonica]|uniref:Endonuclease/exonuclease/phosphatase domain-containing protein n=1 Tax=Eumeta variegata TaxID=151549 RepID=A0A4C1UVR6_EUMVA|nr:hypothetical protein EVAR_18178_1 [Eumeta japonica]